MKRGNTLDDRGEGAGTLLRPAVFLDRDGTIIDDRNYLADPQGVRLIPGAARAIARLNREEIPVLLVTNQSGIGRGYFTVSDFRAVQRRLMQLLAEAGAWLDGVYYCPHSPDLDPPCTCRKPRSGLFRLAARDHEVELSRSFFVGDQERDVLPAGEWGATGFLIGGEPRTREDIPVRVVPDLGAAVDRILASTTPD